MHSKRKSRDVFLRALATLAVALTALLLVLAPYATPLSARQYAQAAPSVAEPRELAPASAITGQSRSLEPGQTPDGLSDSDWESIQAQIDAAKYRAYVTEDGGYVSSNPAHGWQIAYSADGRTGLMPRDRAATPWDWGLQLTGYGYANPASLPAAPRLAASDQTLTYHWDDNLSEWWVNTSRGLKQGFTLQQRPGSSRGRSLVLDLAVTGDLTPVQHGDALAFQDADGATMLSYDKLYVTDVAGQVIPAYLALSHTNYKVRIVVDDADAVYPLTIDPWVQQTKLTASDAAADDSFGWSVAVSGDTAVIGAYLDDDGGSSSGSAYVFTRSGGVWSEQQKLTASDAAASDSFGYSVSVSGDTAVIGAYLDDDGGSASGSAYVFAVAPPPPVLQSMYPVSNTITATLNTTVTATYDAAMDASTVTSRTFAVHGMQSGLVTETHGVTYGGNTLIVTPTNGFHQGELVYAVATTGTQSLAGMNPITATQWQFNAGVVSNRCVGGFSEVYTVTGVAYSSVAWGDYDNDGNLDILLTGLDSGVPIAKVYQNTGSHGAPSGGGFNEVYTVTGVYASSVAWGDYDNDGDLDILLTGRGSGVSISKVYQNTGSHGSPPGGGFSEVYAGSLTGVGNGSVAWGDYDNDGDLDILLTGDSSDGPVAQVYRNDDCSVNTPPTISGILNQSTDIGVAVGPIPFTIGDAETDAGALALAGASSNTSLVPPANIHFGGSGTDRSVTITPTAGLTGTASITITVSDGELAAHDAFVLAVGVNSPPQFTSTPLETASLGQPYTYTVTTADADAGDALTITAPTLPGWLILTQISTRAATLGGVPSASGDYPVVLQVTDGQDNASQPFSITALPSDGDYEPNDTCAQANIIPTDGTVQAHTFDSVGDDDWVAFYATSGISYVVQARIPPTSTADVILELHDSCDVGGSFDSSDPTFSPDIRFTFEAPASGVYYLHFYNYVPSTYGPEAVYHLSVQALQDIVPTGALILAAGRYRADDPLQPNINHVTDALYQLAQEHGCAAEQIYYLSTATGTPVVDAAPTLGNLEYAISTWAVDKVDAQRSLTLYLMDHGDYDGFYLDGHAQRLTPQDLDTWLTVLEQAVPGVKINVIVEACYSGSFIDPLEKVSKPGRLVIASTAADAVAYASDEGAVFSDAFLNALAQGLGLWTAFDEGTWAVNQRPQSVLPWRNQSPWLDDDGDGQPNEPGQDGLLAMQRSFACSIAPPQDNWPPHITAAEIRDLSGNTGKIWAKAQDDSGVDGMWAIVYAPSWQPSQPGEEMIAEPDAVLLPPSEGGYGGLYTLSEIGVYRIVFHARDNGGLVARPRELKVAAGGPFVEPDTSLRIAIPIAGYTTTVDIPAGAVTRTTTFTYTPFSALSSAPAGYAFAGRGFHLYAYQGGQLETAFDLARPITMTMRYSAGDVQRLAEETLALYYWDGSAWSTHGITLVERDTINHHLAATSMHLTQFALFGQERWQGVYLPLVLRQY